MGSCKDCPRSDWPDDSDKRPSGLRGFLDFPASLLSQAVWQIKDIFPPALIPLLIIRMFSSNAAAGLLLDLYKEYGTDLRVGLISSLMMSSTETIFYTISVYFPKQTKQP